MKSMSIKQYFEVVKPKYVYLKLIPDTSIRNYNSSYIAKSIAYMYRNITQSIKRVEKKFIFRTAVKCSFFINIEKDKADFYFIVPDQYLTLTKSKITETWPKVTIDIVESLPWFGIDALKYQVKYEKEDALSLNLDKKCNEPLNSLLNVLDIMEEKDHVGIFYNFMPTSQLPWKKQYSETIEKIKSNKPIDKEKTNIIYILKTSILYTLDIMDYIIKTISYALGAKEEEKSSSIVEAVVTSLTINDKKDLTAATKNKKDSTVLNTQIVVISESKDNKRRSNNAITVCESFNTLSEGNRLIYKKVNGNIFYYDDFKIKKVEENTMSTEECQNFLELPGRTILEQHKQIAKIDVLETDIPEELQSGTMSVGTSTYKGDIKKTFLSNDKNFKFLTLTLIGPTRAGKTTLISNLTKDSLDNKECTILFDFCGNCELSDDVSSVTNNILNIDCSNFDTLQGLGYNEITPANNNIFEVYRCAKAKTSQLMTLINSLNSDDSELKARMERFLEAGALVVFINNGSIKDVFKVLQDHIARGNYVNSIPKNQLENMEEYISTLKELNEYSKASKDNVPKVIGTKISIVSGIINRISKLKQNTYMELMLKKDCKNNINLVEEMQKNQLICIRMPEIMFSTEQEKDIYCTYWITKIWGALQKRKWDISKLEDRVKVNIVFDELYQVPNCQDFLRSKLSQIAKFSCKSIISCHYLGQISLIRNELKAANSSYMLLQGCDKDNFKELSIEFANSGYTVDDLLHLKRYYALNLIKYENGWWSGITKLPKPFVNS